MLDKGEEEVPPGYKYINCHMIFDVKMENYQQKAWLVARGHMTGVPSVPTYASVISCASMQIALTIAASNNLDILKFWAYMDTM